VSQLLQTIVANINRLEEDAGVKPGACSDASRRWAALVRQGKIIFYGHQEVEIGLKDIDWTGKHIRHQEWPAQLNRFFWLPHLAAVYRETGDEEMPRLARATIEDWIDHHNYSAEKPPAEGDNTLNVSIRLGQLGRSGWWGTVPAFAGSPHFDEAFVRRMLESTRGQLACLAAYLAPGSNWRISHLNCLLYCGAVIPEFRDYATFAVRHLNEAFHRQIHDDGSHEEHNPSYHSWMCSVFSQLWRLSNARPELGIRIDPERAARMWDYIVYSTTPDGSSSGLHDAGVWTPGPRAIGSMAARDAFLKEAGLVGLEAWDIRKRPSRFFASAGQAFLRDDWSPESTFLTFDATRWGGGHCHLSRLAVGLYSGSRMLLYDPGIFSYEMSDPYAPYGKSTPAHNTVNLGGLNQTEANPDTYKAHIEADLAVIGSRYEAGYFTGEYTWGWRNGKNGGVFGVHDRVLLWLKGRCALVFDLILSDGRDQPFAAHWQFPIGPHTLDHERGRAWTGGAGDNVLVQRLHSSETLDFVIYEGEKAPLRGWLPAATLSYSPAPLFAMEAKARFAATELVTLLLPFKGESPPEFGEEAFERKPTAAYGFNLSWPDGTEDIVAATPGLKRQVNRSGPLETDGTLAVVRLKNGAPTRAFVLDGMFLDFEGKRLLEQPVAGTYSRRLGQ
jgi:hypothetical protein